MYCASTKVAPPLQTGRETRSVSAGDGQQNKVAKATDIVSGGSGERKEKGRSDVLRPKERRSKPSPWCKSLTGENDKSERYDDYTTITTASCCCSACLNSFRKTSQKSPFPLASSFSLLPCFSDCFRRLVIMLSPLRPPSFRITPFPPGFSSRGVPS